MSNSARNGKKKLAANGGISAVVAVPPPFFLNLREICPKNKLLPFVTIGLDREIKNNKYKSPYDQSLSWAIRTTH